VTAGSRGPGNVGPSSPGNVAPDRPATRALRIGLTGPIGCGKSTVAGWLAARGAVVVDADEEARAVTAPGEPAHAAILERFGDAVRAPDGSLDRAALARVVFADPGALADLEAIVHPAVRPRILAAIGAADAAGVPAVAVEAIKLVEGGLATLCDEVWLVTCGPAAQRARLAARGMAQADAERRIAAQGDWAERVMHVRGVVVIDSSGSRDETEATVDAAYRRALGGEAA
jgi:dephospho-CoA kinase